MQTSEKIFNSLFYMGLTRDQYQRVSDVIGEDNRRIAVSGGFCASLFWIFSLIMSFNSDAYLACRIVYVVALLFSIVSIIVSLFMVKKMPWLLNPTIGVLLMSVLGAGIGIAFCQPDVRTASMIAFVIITPTCFIKNSITDFLMLFITIIVYAVFGVNIIEPDIYSWGLVNLIIFSLAGILVGHAINKERSERFIYEESAKELAEKQARYANHDEMTGLRNRRSYDTKLKALAMNLPEQISVVILDINGLKNVNDTLGHEAGDELIVAAAKCIASAFWGIESIYRTGGDEFCVISEESSDETLRRIEEMKKLMSNYKGEIITDVSISYGYATNQDMKDIKSIVIQADKNMYEYKRDYYAQKDNDRRSLL